MRLFLLFWIALYAAIFPVVRCDGASKAVSEIPVFRDLYEVDQGGGLSFFYDKKSKMVVGSYRQLPGDAVERCYFLKSQKGELVGITVDNGTSRDYRNQENITEQRGVKLVSQEDGAWRWEEWACDPQTGKRLVCTELEQELGSIDSLAREYIPSALLPNEGTFSIAARGSSAKSFSWTPTALGQAVLDAVSHNISTFSDLLFGGDCFVTLDGKVQSTPEIDSLKLREAKKPVRITFVNGIANRPVDALMCLQFISETHGGVNVHYVFRPTMGLAKDIFSAVAVKAGYCSPYARSLVTLWRAMIAEMGGTAGGGKILHYAHSLGAADSHLAAQMLTAEEQKMLYITTFGSPSILPSCGMTPNTVSYVSWRDGISMLDPVGYLTAVFASRNDIQIIGGVGRLLTDHFILSASYSAILKQLGKQFSEEFD